jgi:hypothetical protein
MILRFPIPAIRQVALSCNSSHTSGVDQQGYIYEWWVFKSVFATFMAKPNVICFPLYTTSSKTGKLQSIWEEAYSSKEMFIFSDHHHPP